MVYRVGGVDALIDRGKKIVVLAPDKDATRVALQMALHKYGSLIDAAGTPEWQAELIKAVVKIMCRSASLIQNSSSASLQHDRQIAKRQESAQQTSNRPKSGSGASAPKSRKGTALAWIPQEPIALSRSAWQELESHKKKSQEPYVSSPFGEERQGQESTKPTVR